MLKQYIIYALTILVGVLSIAPYIYAYLFVGPPPADLEGSKLQYFYQDSELRYISRMREITEGNWPVTSPVFYEYKDSPQAQQPFGEGVYAASALGQAELLPFVVLSTKFLFPAILFVLVYLLIYRLLTDTGFSSLRTRQFIALFGSFIIAQGIGIHRLGNTLNLLASDYAAPVLSIWTRSVNPIFGGLILFSVLYLLASAKDRPFSWLRAAVIGVLVGISSAYVFSFVLLVFMLLIWGAFVLINREWERVYELVFAAVIALAINAGYFLSILLGSGGGSSLEKNGLFYTHESVSNNGIVVAGVVLLVAAFVAWQKTPVRELLQRNWLRFGVAALLGSFLAYNQQAITGVAVWPSHFVQYTDPLSLIVILLSVCVIVVGLLNRFQNSMLLQSLFNRAVWLGVPFVIGILVSVQLSSLQSTHTWESDYTDIQKYSPVFELLSTQHSTGDCVAIMLPSQSELRGSHGFEISDNLTAYTPCDSYHSHYVFMAIPEERIMHNYIAYLRLQGVTVDTIDEYLVKNDSEWRDLFFSDWVEKFAHRKIAFLQAMEKPGQVERFLRETPIKIQSAFRQSQDTLIQEWLSKYRLDYVIYTDSANSPGVADLSGDIIYENNDVKVLKITNFD
ncbi:MAG: hypothetical protein ACI9BF_000181 [Candidatus Paceibacteria bacterium]|jgi:hypothetical protein